MKIRDIITEELLDEISRRGFLKGLGAAAVAGAAGGAKADWAKDQDYIDPMTDKVYTSFSNKSTNGEATLKYYATSKVVSLLKNSGRWDAPTQQIGPRQYEYLSSQGRLRVDNGPAVDIRFMMPEVTGGGVTGSMATIINATGPTELSEQILSYIVSAKQRILIDVSNLSGGKTNILQFNIAQMKESVNQGVTEGPQR